MFSQQLNQAIKATKLPKKEFNLFLKTNHQFISLLLKSFTSHLLNSTSMVEDSKIFQKFSFFFLQFFFKMVELDLKQFISIDNLLDLSLVANYHYKNSFQLLINEIPNELVMIEYFKRWNSDCYEGGFVKVYFYLELTQNQTVLVELMKFFCNFTLNSIRIKSIIINILIKYESVLNIEQFYLDKFKVLREELGKESSIPIQRLSLYGSDEELVKIEDNSTDHQAISDKIKRITLESVATDSESESETELAQNLSKNQEILFNFALKSPHIFDSKNRKSKERTTLAKETALSHEQIEGWYKMLMRNEKKDQIIKDFCTFYKKDN